MRATNLPRREFLAVSAAALLASRAVAAEKGELAFTLKETAGLRRFGYPVHTTLPIDPGPNNMRLERNGQAVPAQFRALEPVGGKALTALDFNASPGPLESESYVVRFGPDVKPGPEPKEGMSVTKGDGAWIVKNKGSMTYEVPERLDQLLRSVVNGKTEYIDAGIGLNLLTRNGPMSFVGKAAEKRLISSMVTRQGPLAIGLRVQGPFRFEGLGSVNSIVEMTFPSSKSWVEVLWTVDDPEGWIFSQAYEVQIQVESQPILLDFGAKNTVYGTVRGAEMMVLRAGGVPGFPAPKDGWAVMRRNEKAKTIFATAAGPMPEQAEGWAHVMDRTRCTAVAVDNFGRATADMISAAGDGALTLVRVYRSGLPTLDEANAEITGLRKPVRQSPSGLEAPPVKGPKTLHFWLHFVPMPVQVGAATSPQAMLAPLVVEWKK